MTFGPSHHNQAGSPPDVEKTSSSSHPRPSYRTPFVPKPPNAKQNTGYSLSFLEVLKNNEDKIQAIFNASVPENSEQQQMQRDLWLYLVRMIETKSYSDGFSSSNATENSEKKIKIETNSLPLEIGKWRRTLSQWKHFQGYDGRIGHALGAHELYGLIKSAFDTIFYQSSATPSSSGTVKPKKHWHGCPSSSLSPM